jgi:hypothetical protein
MKAGGRAAGVKKKEKPQRAIGTIHSQLFVEVISDGR